LRPPKVGRPEAAHAPRRLEVSARPVPCRHWRCTRAARAACRAGRLPRSAPPLVRRDIAQERPATYKKGRPTARVRRMLCQPEPALPRRHWPLYSQLHPRVLSPPSNHSCTSPGIP
jgi:hypothetical protein